MRPSCVWAAYTWPRSMKMRQSAGSWFQSASATSAPTSSNSGGVSEILVTSCRSEVAIARIVMGVLAEARQAAADPVCGPIHEGQQRNARITEQPRRLGGINQPALGGFDAGEKRGVPPGVAERIPHPRRE